MLKMSKLTAWKSTHNNKLFCALIAAFAVKIGNSAACFVHNSLGNFNGFIRNDIGNAAFVKAVKNAVRCLFDGIYGNYCVKRSFKRTVIEPSGGNNDKIHGKKNFAKGNVLKTAQKHPAENIRAAGGGTAQKNNSHADAHANSAENCGKKNAARIFWKKNVKCVGYKGKYNNASQSA